MASTFPRINLRERAIERNPLAPSAAPSLSDNDNEDALADSLDQLIREFLQRTDRQRAGYFL